MHKIIYIYIFIINLYFKFHSRITLNNNLLINYLLLLATAADPTSFSTSVSACTSTWVSVNCFCISCCTGLSLLAALSQASNSCQVSMSDENELLRRFASLKWPMKQCNLPAAKVAALVATEAYSCFFLSKFAISFFSHASATRARCFLSHHPSLLQPAAQPLRLPAAPCS